MHSWNGKYKKKSLQSCHRANLEQERYFKKSKEISKSVARNLWRIFEQGPLGKQST